MNLADIRRKAQQQEADPAQGSWQEAPSPMLEEAPPAPQPAVEMVPVSYQAAAGAAPEEAESSLSPAVVECALEEDLLDPEEEAELTRWETLAEEHQEEPSQEPLPAVVQPRPSSVAVLPSPAAVPPLSVPAAASVVAPAVATAAAAVPAAPRKFDPIAAIIKGREEALVGEATGEVVQDESAASVELLCFRVAKEEYAISIMDVKEIIKPRELTEVPRTPPFMGGILSLRGIIIPVFDLRVRLGLSQGEHSPRERIVVVKRERGFCGVLVDQVVEVVRLAVAGVEPPPVVLEGIDREFVQGIGRVEGRMLILLDMEKVLDVTLS